MNGVLMWMACGAATLALWACDARARAKVPLGVTGCNEITCSNSPDTVLFGGSPGFHELSLSGTPNRNTVAIDSKNGHAQILKENKSYDLHVRHGRIIGISGADVLQAGDLVGATIKTTVIGGTLRGGSSYSYTLQITNVRWFPMPFGQDGTVETYRITFIVADALDPPPVPLDDAMTSLPSLCASNEDGDTMRDDTFPEMEPGEVLAFEGDRIDVAHKTMDPKPDPEWFNFGCAGSAAAKLYLMGETVATQANPLDVASWQERQAMLKMLTADYCGTGRAFTISGEPLLWQGGHISYALPPLGLEARWNANGAICLGTPRLEVHQDPKHEFSPDVVADIVAECGQNMPPECRNTDPHDSDGAVVTSANRP